jgi:hypothetical protein
LSTCGKRGKLRFALGTQPQHLPGSGALLGVSLRQREWDRADGQQQKQIKCASDEMRFDGGVNLLFHFNGVLVICRDVT